MISYQQKQYQLIREIEEKFKNGDTPSTIVDPVNDYVNDDRICLTSVTFIPPDIQKEIISKVITPLSEIDEDQYYYLPNSLHLTIQNIRTINKPPSFTDDDIEKAKPVFRKIIPKYQAFMFEVKNIFELPTSFSICAFSNEVLQDLVLELRKGLLDAGVPDNKTYASNNVVFGNISICRYTSKPSQKLLDALKKLKEVEIGKFIVTKVSLITTNSVCHPAKTKIVEEYSLR